MPYISAIVAVSSAHLALSMMELQISSPSLTAFFAAFSRPVVILSMPLITWSRLIFLLIPFSPVDN